MVVLVRVIWSVDVVLKLQLLFEELPQVGVLIEQIERNHQQVAVMHRRQLSHAIVHDLPDYQHDCAHGYGQHQHTYLNIEQQWIMTDLFVDEMPAE